MKTPCKCPVCEGKGIVLGGFYNSLGEYYTSSSVTEMCRQCIGSGLVWTESEGTIEALQRENEKLKAQVAVMREALKTLNGYLQEEGQCKCVCGENECATCTMLRMVGKILSSDAGKDYHNSTDVKALKLAKDALNSFIWESTNKYIDVDEVTFNKTTEAIETIDKALGVNEDEGVGESC